MGTFHLIPVMPDMCYYISKFVCSVAYGVGIKYCFVFINMLVYKISVRLEWVIIVLLMLYGQMPLCATLTNYLSKTWLTLLIRLIGI